jgi:recombination protein RecA
LLDTGVAVGTIEKNGNTYMFKDVKLGVGRETAKAFLKENAKVSKEIDAEVRKRVKEGDVVVAAAKPEEAEGEE